MIVMNTTFRLLHIYFILYIEQSFRIAHFSFSMYKQSNYSIIHYLGGIHPCYMVECEYAVLWFGVH